MAKKIILDVVNESFGRYPQLVIGSAKTPIKEGWYAYGCICRLGGSIIASMEKTVEGVVSDVTDVDIIGVEMNDQEWWSFGDNKVTSVTQTASTDEFIYFLNKF